MLGFVLSWFTLRLLSAILGGYGIFCLFEFHCAGARREDILFARHRRGYRLFC
jgi:hypothetical protein